MATTVNPNNPFDEATDSLSQAVDSAGGLIVSVSQKLDQIGLAIEQASVSAVLSRWLHETLVDHSLLVAL